VTLRYPKQADYDVQVAFADVEQRLQQIESRLDLIAPSASPEEVGQLRADLAKVARSVNIPAMFDTRNVFRGAGDAHALGLVPNPGPYAPIVGDKQVLHEDGTWRFVLDGLLRAVPAGLGITDTGGAGAGVPGEPSGKRGAPQRVVNVLASLAVLNAVSADTIRARVFDGITNRSSFADVAFGGSSSPGLNSNQGSGETNLSGHTHTLPGDYLKNGDGILLVVLGSLAANTNAKTLRLDIAGQKFLIMSSSSNVANNRFVVVIYFNRRTSTTGQVGGVYFANAAHLGNPTVVLIDLAISSVNFAIDQVVKLTAQSGAVADNDLTVTSSFWLPIRGFGSVA
jgi:hypothetical protein